MSDYSDDVYMARKRLELNDEPDELNKVESDLMPFIHRRVSNQMAREIFKLSDNYSDKQVRYMNILLALPGWMNY